MGTALAAAGALTALASTPAAAYPCGITTAPNGARETAMAAETGGLAAKLPEEETRALAADGATGCASVLVSLAVPPSRLTAAVVRRAAPGPVPPGRQGFAIEGPDEAEVGRVAEGLGSLLERLVGHRPRYLSAARAFVLEADGATLRELAASPLVREVRLNRRLR